MYEYLKLNKKWIFSAIGVVVILVVWQVIIFVGSVLFDSNSKTTIIGNDHKQEIHEEQPESPKIIIANDHKEDIHEEQPESATIKDELEQPAKRSPVTLDEFNAMLKNEAIADLQRQEFIKKHDGRIIKWEGIVANVKELSSFREESEIIVVYRPVSQADKALPDVFTAVFPHTAKSDLAALAEGDLIEFEGVLENLSFGTSYSPSARDCVLLRHEKRVRKRR